MRATTESAWHALCERLETTWEALAAQQCLQQEAVSRFGAAASSCEERACFRSCPERCSRKRTHLEQACPGMVAEPLN